MRKSNLIKGIVCGLMLTAVVGTVALANVDPASTRARVRVGNGEFVLDVEDYYDYYTGTYGTFNLTGAPSTTKLSVTNNSGSENKFYVEALTINNSLGPDQTEDSDYKYANLTPGASTSVTSYRDYDYPGHRYFHNGKSYYANTTSVVIDNYTCTLYQYR